MLAASVLSFALGGPCIFTLPYLGTSFVLWIPIAFVGNLVMMMIVWDFPAGRASGFLNLAYNSTHSTEKVD